MVYIFLADGFEEVEALGTIDILRRCGMEVQTLSTTGRRVVTGAHGIVIKADSLFRRNHVREARAIVIPGGTECAKSLRSNLLLCQTIAQQCTMGVYVAAICAGPTVLVNSGVLHGRHVTCYPSLRHEMGDAVYHDDCCAVLHDNIITGSGPAATPAFALTLAEALVGAEVANQVKNDMLFNTASNTVGKVLKFEGSRVFGTEHQTDVIEPFRPATPSPAMGSARGTAFGDADSDELIF